jgi:hypothetical protein
MVSEQHFQRQAVGDQLEALLQNRPPIREMRRAAMLKEVRE